MQSAVLPDGEDCLERAAAALAASSKALAALSVCVNVADGFTSIRYVTPTVSIGALRLASLTARFIRAPFRRNPLQSLAIVMHLNPTPAVFDWLPILVALNGPTSLT